LSQQCFLYFLNTLLLKERGTKDEKQNETNILSIVYAFLLSFFSVLRHKTPKRFAHAHWDAAYYIN